MEVLWEALMTPAFGLSISAHNTLSSEKKLLKLELEVGCGGRRWLGISRCLAGVWMWRSVASRKGGDGSERWRLRGSPRGVLSSERRAGRTRELASQQSGGVPKEPVGAVCLGSAPWPRGSTGVAWSLPWEGRCQRHICSFQNLPRSCAVTWGKGWKPSNYTFVPCDSCLQILESSGHGQFKMAE